MPRTEAQLRSRILRWGLLLAVLVQVLWSFRPGPSRAQTSQEELGQRLYEANCSTCHGLTGDGTANGPTLQGAGPASVGFMLSTGRMPLANPDAQPQRQDPAFSDAAIDALLAYVATIAPGGEPLPDVDPAAGSLSEGAAVFLDNCAACHGAGASGDSIGGGQIAPSLGEATPQQIAEAVRIGPGTMPPFNPRSLSEQQLNSLVRYVTWLGDGGGGGGGDQLGRVGAVAEGLIAGVVGLGLLVVVIRLDGVQDVRRPERVVAIAFAVSILAALGLAGVYVAGGQTQAEGALLLLALGGIGVGLLVWALRLLPGIGDETQPRPRRRQADEAPRAAADAVLVGAGELGRRRFLTRLLLGALAALGVAALFPIRSLGRAPGGSLFSTPWRAGMRLVTIDGTPVTSKTLEVGAFTTVFPEGFVGSADGQAVLINVGDAPLVLPPEGMAGAPDGLVCYSKICTHAGCPVGLYLAQEHQLRCPCHQSTFDVLDGARPVYGPAPKPLPQLPIEVGVDGTLHATGDFDAPVGPSFWDLPPA